MLTVVPVGEVVGGRSASVDDDWDAVTATIRLDATRFTPAALRGLDAFSHLEVRYRLHRVSEDAVHAAARRPRGNPARPSALPSSELMGLERAALDLVARSVGADEHARR